MLNKEAVQPPVKDCKGIIKEIIIEANIINCSHDLVKIMDWNNLILLLLLKAYSV